MFKKLIRNPFFIFLPFLAYYVYAVIQNKWPTLYGDELRYVQFAKNLLHGFYSPPAPHINLWNGPGYPILLMPLIALHIPMLYITMMNALYLYLAIVLLYKTLSIIANRKIALILSLLMAIYPNAVSMLPILYTEAITTLLISALAYAVTLYIYKGDKKYGIIAGLTLGFLVLTKIIFGYVILVCLAIFLAALFFKSNVFLYKKAVRILFIALAVAIPYLVYTWHITGKLIYWGNSGGMSLYWMSTPYPQEYGDWKVPYLTNNQYPTLFKASPQVVRELKKNHSAQINYILKHNEIEQDELFKLFAIENIKAHPVKFINNYIFNWSRMLFNFPYSYSYQDANVVRNILIGSSILWASVAGIILTLANWQRITFAVKFILMITAVYLLISGALSAYPRQLDVAMPLLFFWLGYLAANIKKPGLKFTTSDELDHIELTELEGMGVLLNGGK